MYLGRMAEHGGPSCSRCQADRYLYVPHVCEQRVDCEGCTHRICGTLLPWVVPFPYSCRSCVQPLQAPGSDPDRWLPCTASDEGGSMELLNPHGSQSVHGSV